VGTKKPPTKIAKVALSIAALDQAHSLSFGAARVARFIERLGNGEDVPLSPIYASLRPYVDAERFVEGLIATGLVSTVSLRGELYLRITPQGGLALLVFYTGG
jgi:hypothetical protein